MKKINEVLNIDDDDEEIIEAEIIPADKPVNLPQIGGAVELERDAEDDRLESDFGEALDNIKDVIIMAKTAAKRVSDIADDSESDKDFAALNNLLKNITDSSKGLMELYKLKIDYREKKRKVKMPDAEPITGNTTNIQNNTTVFSGNSQQLMEYLKNKK